MKIPQVRGLERFERHHRDGHRTHHITLYRQPMHRWLAARVYHWYDMRVCRLPGFELLERFKGWRYRNRDWHEYLPISAKQDCRCWYLSEHGKTVLATIDVPEDVYRQLAGEPAG